MALPGQPNYRPPAYKGYADNRPVPMGRPIPEKLLHRVKLLVLYNGKYLSAHYSLYRLSGWKLKGCDPELEFLRSCGKPQDARRALQKRGMSWSWDMM